MKSKIIAQGAEAILIQEDEHLIKDRIKKGYRNSELDLKLRKSRTRHEAKILERAIKIVPVPKILGTNEFKIEMEFIKGKKLSDELDKMPEKEAFKVCKLIGQEVAKLHNSGIIHGDLTTSNMILKNNKVFLIDFGLGFHSVHVEDKAVDIHLLKEALQSKHFRNWEKYFQEFIKGYKNEQVLRQLEKVEKRGRYKQKD
jgi:TP53 regulating kinase-like protein